MTVDELRIKLAGVPGHLPVVVEDTFEDEACGGVDTQYLLTLDADLSGVPQCGRAFVIVLGEEGAA